MRKDDWRKRRERMGKWVLEEPVREGGNVGLFLLCLRDYLR